MLKLNFGLLRMYQRTYNPTDPILYLNLDLEAKLHPHVLEITNTVHTKLGNCRIPNATSFKFSPADPAKFESTLASFLEYENTPRCHFWDGLYLTKNETKSSKIANL